MVSKPNGTATIEKQFQEVREIAIGRCDELIEWYEKSKKTQRHIAARSRIAAIFFSGLVPVLVIVQMSLKGDTFWWVLVGVLIALFPATAAIISALNNTFQYKDNWVLYSVTAEELKSEKVKYRTRCTIDYDNSLDEYKALSNFVTRIESITIQETKQWQNRVGQAKDLDELLKYLESRAPKGDGE